MDPGLLFAVTVVWQETLGEQRLAAFAGETLLVPRGTAFAAYAAVRGHGILSVPCRIQGLVAFPVPQPRVPGLPSGRSAPPWEVCLAGRGEIHCLAADTGSLRWKARQADGCALALNHVGDVDFDGALDLVSCGCTHAERCGGRTIT